MISVQIYQGISGLVYFVFIIGHHTTVLKKIAFESQVLEFVDFKVTIPDVCILESDPELYYEGIERWATSIPTA